MESRPDDISRLLADGADANRLFPLVYDEMRALARRRMQRERSDHTLQATALAHEAWERLACDTRMDWRGRRHFFGAAAEAMRRILVDHARRVNAEKRGGGRERVTLGAVDAPLDVEAERLLALTEALEQLESEDPRAAEVTRLRFLAGLSVEETAAALGIGERTVAREWAFARARLFELLED